MKQDVVDDLRSEETAVVEPNPFQAWIDLGFWALPLQITVQRYGVAVGILCFRVHWIWAK